MTARDNRLFVEAVLCRFRAGLPWRDLPERFGDGVAVHRRFSRWAKRLVGGVWLTLGGILATFDDQAASRNLRSSRSRLAWPYIWRLRVFSRLICPSTGPLLQASVKAAHTAS